jgi:hypothetical protein
MFQSCATDFTVYYVCGTDGWSNPWYGYPTACFDYLLTYTAGTNGTLTGMVVQGVKASTDGTTVTAVPNSGYHFVSWSDNNSTVAVRTDTGVAANTTASATFAINSVTISTYTLTYTPGANGTITGTTSQTVDQGTSGTIVTATPDTGYHFVSWSDGITTAARTDTNVTANITATASFAVGIACSVSVQIPDQSAPYIVDAAAPHGSFYSGTVAGTSTNVIGLAVEHAVSVTSGDTITVTADIPLLQQDRYYVYMFLVNGVPVVPTSYAAGGYKGLATLSTVITSDTTVVPYFEILGDLNLDGHVDILDLNILLSVWNVPDPQTQIFVNKHIRRDINRDNTVGLGDVSLLLGNYGT